MENDTTMPLFSKAKGSTKGTPGAFGGQKRKKLSKFPTHSQLRKKMQVVEIPSSLQDKKIGWILNNYNKEPHVKEFILKHFPHAFV